jgi:MFS family permease
MRSWSFEKLGITTNASSTDKPTGGLEKHQWVEPWYLSYALLGCTMGGMFPILMPLLALQRFNSACHVGLVMAAFNLGGLIAPLLGNVADRYGIHRTLLISGLIITAISMAGFAFTNTFPVWLGLALIQGIGVFVAMTVGNLFIVETHPKTEWDQRIGWLQTFNSGGQVCGMLLAATMSQIEMSSSLLIAAGLITAAVLPGCLTPKMTHEAAELSQARFNYRRLCNLSKDSPHPQVSHLRLKALAHFSSLHHTPFEHLMEVWLLCVAGTSAIYTLYPVMMKEMYGIGQDVIALSFAFAMGISVFLYTQAGYWVQRFGPACILKNFMGVRLTVFIIFFLLAMLRFSGSFLLIVLSFALIVLCWPFIIVSATAFTASLSPIGEGEGMGIFFAVLAAACITGSALGGWIAAQWGYHAAIAMVVSTESLGLIFMYKIR